MKKWLVFALDQEFWIDAKNAEAAADMGLARANGTAAVGVEVLVVEASRVRKFSVGLTPQNVDTKVAVEKRSPGRPRGSGTTRRTTARGTTRRAGTTTRRKPTTLRTQPSPAGGGALRTGPRAGNRRNAVPA
jgi:hypothetical protein